MPRTRLAHRLLAAATSISAVASPAIAASPAHASVPTVSPASTPAAVTRVYAPGTRVSQLGSTQVLVADRTGGTRGTWVRWSWNGRQWVRVDNRRSAAVFGRGGVVAAALRRQGTSTTPAGTFSMGLAFGAGNPGTRMPYRRVTSCSWWIQDTTQRDYNRWRESCRVPASVARQSEHLADYVRSGLYRQAALIHYNYWTPDRYGAGSGAGIFLHYARTYTGGCVGLTDMAELTDTIRWMDPARRPVIVVKS